MMGSPGWMRKLISQNMGIEEYVFYVARCLESEFKSHVQIKIENETIILNLGGYEITFSLLDAQDKKEKGGSYELDKFILNQLEKVGFEFDRERSKYIQYCYEIFHRDEGEI